MARTSRSNINPPPTPPSTGDGGAAATGPDGDLHKRLEQVLAGRTYKSIAEMTGISTETARRYMLGQTPSAEFLAAVCEKMAVNAEWLLTGEGPARVDELAAEALKRATTAQLVGVVARHVGTLTERVERLESAVATIQRRLPRTSDPLP